MAVEEAWDQDSPQAVNHGGNDGWIGADVSAINDGGAWVPELIAVKDTDIHESCLGPVDPPVLFLQDRGESMTGSIGVLQQQTWWGCACCKCVQFVLDEST